MAEGYTFITPAPVAGQQGTDWMRWLDSYAQTHATAVAQMTVRDFPAWVAAHIEEEAEGETATKTNLIIVTILMARLGYAHGVSRVPISMDDAAVMTQALVLDRALATLQTSAIIGRYAMDDPALGAHASPFGAALQYWLTAVLAGAGVPPL
jgi:hypothetical protein